MDVFTIYLVLSTAISEKQSINLEDMWPPFLSQS